MSSNKGFVQNSKSEKPNDRERTERLSSKIPVIEEKLQVRKEVIETGGFRINKKVHTEDVIVEVPVKQEELTVERVPINEYVDTPPPAVRHEGDTMIVPVLKEVVVKRLVLVEELHITRKTVQKQSETDVSLRKEEVNVERIKPDTK